MYQKLRWFFSLLISIAIFSSCSEKSSNPIAATSPFDLEYSVEIDPDDFEDEDIDGNDYFILVPGTTYVHLGQDEDGVGVRVEEEILSDTKVIMGVNCRIVNAREYEDENGNWTLIEDTFDWYAEDKDGNVWYFGEDSREIENDEIVSTAGSWEAGQDGALPGIIMLDKPLIGLSYRQEYYEDEAEDVANVLSLNATTPNGAYNDCLQTAEWSLLEPGIIEHKYYEEDVGLVYVIAVEGEEGFEALTEIITP